jgi:hypothetical protein
VIKKKGERMRYSIILLIVLMFFTVFTACGKRIMVPPRYDLKNYEDVGIIEFAFKSEGNLGEPTTERFIEAIRRDQGMVKIVELGTESEVLKAVGKKKFDRETFKEIGEKFDVSTIFMGELLVSDVRPDISIGPGLVHMRLSAEVDASLGVKMIETETGASIWSTNVEDTEKVSEVSYFGGTAFAFDAENPDEAYGDLIYYLVERASIDFRVTWE